MTATWYSQHTIDEVIRSHENIFYNSEEDACNQSNYIKIRGIIV